VPVTDVVDGTLSAGQSTLWQRRLASRQRLEVTAGAGLSPLVPPFPIELSATFELEQPRAVSQKAAQSARPTFGIKLEGAIEESNPGPRFVRAQA
jgi:hypothetical protein